MTVHSDSHWLPEERTKRRPKLSVTLVFSAFVMAILVIALAMATGVVLLIQSLQGEEFTFNLSSALLMVLGISAVMGYGLAVLFGSTVLLKPINRLVDAMDGIADGNFETRLDLSGTLLSAETFRGIEVGFNRMAEELGHTEMLRSDFVNNFSHEFKTPIVSIAGFCDLLRSEDIGDEEKSHYLTIISEESRRLAALATNILNLTKIENQSILTDVTSFNLSEQIRSAVLVLESKWATRGIIPVLEFDEVKIRANEQLLKEVWINLIDNAIKFSPDCREVTVTIKEDGGRITVSISNEGKEIPENIKEKIFLKFYQADESHSAEGSGVGLAVVKKVVNLHGGAVSVESEGGRTVFSVTLPRYPRLFGRYAARAEKH